MLLIVTFVSLLLNALLLALYISACFMWNKADAELKYLEWKDRMRKSRLMQDELDKLQADPTSGDNFTALDTEF